MFDPALFHHSAVLLQQANAMSLGSPIDAHEELKMILQAVSFPSRPTVLNIPPVLALESRRELPTGFSARTTTPGRTSFPGARRAQGAVWHSWRAAEFSTGLLHPAATWKGTGYQEFLKRVAQESGIATPRREQLARL